MLCEFCRAGEADKCSGWCGIPEPEYLFGPIPKDLIDGLTELGIDIDLGWDEKA